MKCLVVVLTFCITFNTLPSTQGSRDNEKEGKDIDDTLNKVQNDEDEKIESENEREIEDSSNEDEEKTGEIMYGRSTEEYDEEDSELDEDQYGVEDEDNYASENEISKVEDERRIEDYEYPGLYMSPYDSIEEENEQVRDREKYLKRKVKKKKGNQYVFEDSCEDYGGRCLSISVCPNERKKFGIYCQQSVKVCCQVWMKGPRRVLV